MTLTFKSFWRAGNYVLKKPNQNPFVPLAFNNFFFKMTKFQKICWSTGRNFKTEVSKNASQICHHFSTVFKTGVLMMLIPSFSLTFFLNKLHLCLSASFVVFVWQTSAFFSKVDVMIVRRDLWSSLQPQRKGQMLHCILVFQS